MQVINFLLKVISQVWLELWAKLLAADVKALVLAIHQSCRSCLF